MKTIPDLKEVLKEEIRTMARMVNVMNPKSEGELMAVCLPNLHTRMHEYISDIKKSLKTEIEMIIATESNLVNLQAKLHEFISTELSK